MDLSIALNDNYFIRDSRGRSSFNSSSKKKKRLNKSEQDKCPEKSNAQLLKIDVTTTSAGNQGSNQLTTPWICSTKQSVRLSENSRRISEHM